MALGRYTKAAMSKSIVANPYGHSSHFYDIAKKHQLRLRSSQYIIRKIIEISQILHLWPTQKSVS